MKFISLPNGTIVNLDHVAYISADGGIPKTVEGTTKTVFTEGWINIYFAVPRAVEKAGQEFHMKLKINGKNAEVFLDELLRSGVDTRFLSKARKTDKKQLEIDYTPNFMG